MGQPDPLLRLPAVYHGERSSHRGEGRRRATSHGRRPGHLHPGLLEAIRGQGGVSTVEERSYLEAARREKRLALEALGVRPFAYRYDRSHTAQQALQEYADAMGENGPLVSIAGRIASLRSQGKTIFAHLEDSSGRIQIYF